MVNETIEEGRGGVAGGGTEKKNAVIRQLMHVVQLLDFVTLCNQHFCF